MLKKLFRSVKLTIFLLCAIILISIIGTVIPQNQNPQEYIEHYGEGNYLLLNKLGLFDIYRSWLFLALLFLLSLNLIYCLSSRPILKRKFLGFTLTHLGFIIILLGAIVGAVFGEKGYIQIYEGQSLNGFMNRSGEKINLPFTVFLEKFSLEYYDSGTQKLSVKVLDKNVEKELPVNFNQKYDIAGTNYYVEIERYLPDFAIDTTSKQAFSRTNQANNPALLVKITSPTRTGLPNPLGEGPSPKGQTEERWVFGRFPEMQFNQQDKNIELAYYAGAGEIKDFKSKINILENNQIVLTKTIEVNHPLNYKGYYFYQASYDSQNLKWSGLQVAKDPGVGIVYSGFAFIIFGLIINFYFKGDKK